MFYVTIVSKDFLTIVICLKTFLKDISQLRYSVKTNSSLPKFSLLVYETIISYSNIQIKTQM